LGGLQLLYVVIYNSQAH